MRKGLILVAATLFVVSGALLATRPSRDLRDFRRAADDLVARSESLRQRASTFDPDAVLSALGPSSWNGEYYRLDEHLASARIEARSPRVDRASPSIAGAFDFDGGQDEHCRAEGKAVLENGILKMSFADGDHVVCRSPSGIPNDSVGSIRFRLKVRGAAAVDVGWSRSDLTAWSLRPEINMTTLQTIPDGEFHVYELVAETSINSRHSPGSRLRTFFLHFPEGGEGDIELDYIQLLSPRAAYPASAGMTHFTPPGTPGALLWSRGLPAGLLPPGQPELRQGLYSYSGVGLQYEVSVPQEVPMLRFGMSVLEDDPVRFSVTVTDNGRKKEVYSSTVPKLHRWVDAEVDLSAWAGKRIELRLDAESGSGNVAFWSNPMLAGRRRASFNVLLVLEDTERADHLSLYGYERLTSPVKDRFATGGVVFERAFSQAPATRPSCPSFMTSLYPSATGVVVGETLPQRYLTLAEVMRSQGFLTASFIQNTNAGPAAGLHQGFGQLFHIRGAAEAYGKPFFDWLQELGERNFFAYLHVLDPHGVYDPPADFRGWYEELAPGRTPVERDDLEHDPAWVETPTLEGRRALYDGEIRANDHHFERLLEELERLELLKDTLVIFLADHGEHLGERGLWEHHDPTYVQVLHVPLFMVYPERIRKGVRVAEPVQLLDVMPTILDIAGIDTTGMLLQGRSLLPLIEGREAGPRLALSEGLTNFHGEEGPAVWGSILFRQWHVLRTTNDGPAAVFDLDDNPEEEGGGRPAPELAESLELLMRKMKETNVQIRRALMAGALSEVQTSIEDQERLRALGYIR